MDFNERIRINGEMISDEDLVAMATEYLPYSEKFGGTFFEITTAMAFEYFAKKKVDIAIIETGLGGRFDSTNVLTPLVSIITSIDYDHTEYLGDTIEKIAFEKAGIIKQNVPLVLSQNAPEVREVIKNRFDRVNGIEDDFYYSRIDPNHKKYFVRSPLLGRHVKENLSVVISALDFLRNTYTISDEAIMGGISKVRENTGLSSRIELLQENPPLLLDVCHNESAIATLIDTLKSSFSQHEKWDVVFAAMKDKNTARILRGSTQIYEVARSPWGNSVSGIGQLISMEYMDSPSTTSATTYKVQLRSASGSGNVTSSFNIPINPNRKIQKTVNLLGKESKPHKNIPFIEIYDDDSVKKKIIID